MSVSELARLADHILGGEPTLRDPPHHRSKLRIPLLVSRSHVIEDLPNRAGLARSVEEKVVLVERGA